MRTIILSSIVIGVICGVFSLIVGVIAVAYDWVKGRREVR